MPASTYAKVSISQRSNAFAVAGIKAALALQELTPTTTAYRLGRFTPARVYTRKGAAVTSDDRISRITGRRYKSYYTAGDEGFSMPYGQTTETATIQERQTAITAAIKAADTTINLISFSPEKVR